MCTGRHLELMASCRRDLDFFGFLSEVEREVDQDAIKKVYRTLFLNMDHWKFYIIFGRKTILETYPPYN